jgi:hypothetical protein
VTGRQTNSTCGFIFTDQVRCGRSGKNGIFSDYEFFNAICRANFDDYMCGFKRKKTAISANYNGRAFGWDRIEGRLDEVFCIVLMTKINDRCSTYERSILPLVEKRLIYALGSEHDAIQDQGLLTVF